MLSVEKPPLSVKKRPLRVRKFLLKFRPPIEPPFFKQFVTLHLDTSQNKFGTLDPDEPGQVMTLRH